jgi:multiple sugar transport system permease protein
MSTVTTPPPAALGAPAQAAKPEPAARSRFGIGRALAWLFMILAILASLFPFYWMLRTALSSNNALYAGSKSLLPVQFSWGGFERVFGLQTGQAAINAGGAGQPINFWRYLLNSVVVATLITAGQVFFSAMAAYAFARLRWRHREKVFAFFLTGLMIPTIFTLLPNFVLIKELGLVDTLLGIALPSMLMTPFAVFFLRQFFLSVPREVEEAAVIDGAGRWGIFWRVVLPMSRGPLVTIGLTTAVWAWKDFLWPLLVGRGEQTRVLTVALGVFLQQSPNTQPDWTGLMAASVLSVLPVLALLVFLGKRLVQSLNFTGIK